MPGRTLKLSRFQASLWNELQEVGVVTAQAAAWQKSVGGLLAGDEVVDRRVPATLQATLRPYQQDGFQLARLPVRPRSRRRAGRRHGPG